MRAVIIKKVTAMLTATCLLTGLMTFLPGNLAVQAAEPSGTQFAGKEQLLSFSLQYDEEIGRIKYGADGRAWLIAGADLDEGLTLLSASSIGDVEFGTNNEYLSSNIYENILPGYLNSNFSLSEERNMKEVTIEGVMGQGVSIDYTVDTQLYIPDAKDRQHGEGKQEINIGTKEMDTIISLDLLNDIYKFESGNNFWLRSFQQNSQTNELRVGKNGLIEGCDVSSPSALVPVFNLDVSSVLFASVAPAAASNGPLTTEEAFTLRYEDASLGLAVINLGKKGVAISGIKNPNTYLVVQNDSGAWAKKVGEHDAVAASEVTIGGATLSSFADCKVWLETTNADERITTAALASWSKTADVTVKAGSNMKKTADSGGEVQTGLNTAMTDVVYTADSGCYFPENYNQDGSMNQNGITVVRNSDTQITVSGTPEDNTVITLGDAARTPVFAITVNPDKLTFGTVNAGYTQPGGKTVTITNTGNSPITLRQPTGKNYKIGALSKTGLGAGESAAFTVQPNANLAAGTYDEKIDITVDQGAGASVDVSFTVSAKHTSVRTGDENHGFIWLILLLLSAGGGIIAAVRKIRKKTW